MTDLDRYLTPQRLAELRTTADNANYVVILKRVEVLALLDAADAAPDIIRQAKAEAWDEGAHTAWERSTPEVNGARYHWRSDGEPVNPYEKGGQQ